jgi:hypothetical protein
VQRRTMHFLRRLNPAFEQRSAVLPAQARIPSLDEQSRMKLHSETRGDVGMRSTLIVSNLCMMGV